MCFELILLYKARQCDIPDDHNLYIDCDENLKSNVFVSSRYYSTLITFLLQCEFLWLTEHYNGFILQCEWLLGDRHPSLEDMDTGLDPDGPMYNAIMSNPAIRLSLSSPKMLLGAFVQDKYKNLGRVSCFCTVLSETPTMLVQQQ